MPDAPEVVLTVEGAQYRGWLGVNVNWALDDMAASFAVEYFDRWSNDSEPWRIFPDDECILYVDSAPIVAGHVVSTDVRYDADSVALTAQGYSYTGLLAKCSASHKTGHWRNQPLAQIVDDLVSPFGITAIVDSGAAPDKIRRFDLEEGERVAAAIERLCRMLGIIATCNQDGFLIVGRSGTAALNQQRLRLPPSSLSREIHVSNGDRYSDYLTKGQLSGTDEFHGPNTVLQSATAQDPGVRVFSPMLIDAEGPGGKKHLETRAKFERNVRYGRSRTVTLEFDTLYDLDGKVMSPGSFCYYSDPHLGITGEFIVGALNITLNTSGFFCTIKLMPPETFNVLDIPPAAWRRRG